MRRWLWILVWGVALWSVSSAGARTDGWSIQSTPNPAGATSSGLNAVSCTAASACTAVGSSGSGTLAERWDGRTWMIQPTPNRAAIATNVLNGVSCSGPTACTAVGYSWTSTGAIMTLAERWDGRTWNIQPTPNPPGSVINQLDGVSCSRANECIAAGLHTDANGDFEYTLVERWDGRRWEILRTPNPSTTFNEFRGVSCVTRRGCTAVGDYSASGLVSALAERWNGRTWQVEPVANPAGGRYNVLFGVSCRRRGACIAVGTYFTRTGDEFMLAERSQRSRWEVQQTASPAGMTRSILAGVSCATPHDCTAVGSYDTRPAGTGVAFAGIATLAEHWNGTTWEIQATPNPAVTTGINLLGVSCPTPRACTAVGVNSISSSPLIPSNVTLAEGFTAGD